MRITKIEIRGRILQLLGITSSIVAAIWLMRVLVPPSALEMTEREAYLYFVGHAVWIGLVGTVLLFAYVSLFDNLKRPFIHVPWDGRWWEFIVMGAFGVPLILCGLTLFLCATVVLPVLVPIKLLYEYVFGPSATLYSAFLSFPVVFITASFAFAILFIILIETGKGNLSKGGQLLNSGVSGQGYSALEVIYFSASTMIKGTPQYEATGWCRWAALLEVLVGRLLELGIVTIGFAIIIRQSFSAAPHP